MRTMGRPLVCRSSSSRLQQPLGQAPHARLDRVDADRREVAQANLDGGNRQVVERAVLEARFAGREDVATALARWRSSRCRPANQGAAAFEARRCAPADTRRRSDSRTSCRTRCSTKSGRTARRSRRLVGHERRRVEQHVPPARVRLVDELERMLHAGEIRLRGKREQIVRGRGRLASSSSRSRSRSMRSSGVVSGA